MKHTVGQEIKIVDSGTGKIIEAVVTKIELGKTQYYLYIRRKDNKAFRNSDGTFVYNIWITGEDI